MIGSLGVSDLVLEHPRETLHRETGRGSYGEHHRLPFLLLDLADATPNLGASA